MTRDSLYRAIWRWHFYAGLIVLPVLALMAVTGALYLYKPEVEAMLYPVNAPAHAGQAQLPPSHIVSIVERNTGAKAIQLLRPAADTENWRVTVRTAQGDSDVNFVDTFNGRILGRMRNGGAMQVIRDLHSLALTGPVGNRLVEVVAGWAILLCITGLYLRWPRRGQPALAIRGRPGGRLFWRDLHGSLGFASAAVLLFLAVTGMPWTDMWGGGLRAIIAANGAGRPAMKVNPWAPQVKAALPWTLREGGAAAGMPGDIGVDAVAGIAARRGLASGYMLFLPASPGAPYLVSAITTRANDARAITIDAASGAVVQDIDWRMFGPGAKAVEWGVATHMGQQYGEANRLLMLAGCLCLLLLCLTAPLLWWKRGLSTPPPASPGALRVVAGLMLALGLLFPLTGLSMIAALCGEWLAGRMRRAWFPFRPGRTMGGG
ncbi:PepSY domain-containing protein [Sphingobium sp. HBC34]|uniref:PepSY domain-containing protein n=1 Tax=Sphingobium cyanobacteriorum TaxID=3063954 RepID=A0ABT8ZI23_9SPHN|nr:PepSY domain-containing protein [Sphingobium sp. HBC34]MDO7833842.1 PepSY domain-containing protein [Sphingobium sp. HBC34]